ncbi:MAG TPA: TAT-variant-translocated molybdopterin oxidoreductase [Abditibacteriaceae bacterium]|jgi:molybdopterin-containing oxidoreductase family iron-sulfur binding subunit
MSNNAKPSDNLQPANFIPLTAVTPSAFTHREVSDVTPAAGAASTVGAAPSVDLDKVRERLAGTRGQEYWRCLEELSEKPEFTRYLQREFPRQAPRDMTPLSRRDFMKFMGAAMALAGVGGCAFQPAEKIVPYVNSPEEMIPGIPLYFATAYAMNGHALGVLAESHMGRPTKIEGNPDHPASLGRADIWAQASVLDLYDPDRSQGVRYLGDTTSWDNFAGAFAGAADAQRARRGAGLRVLSETVTSPTLGAQMADFLRAFPQAQWVQWDPINRDNARAGAVAAFGRDALPQYRFDRADVIVSLDADFLMEEPNHVRWARDFIQRRRPHRDKVPMNRLYVAESTPRNTGAMADHRLPVRASEVQNVARAIAAGIGVGGVSGGAVTGAGAAWVKSVIADLQGARGRSLVVAGSHQPAAVHALAHAMNDALGNVGATVEYSDPIEAAPTDQVRGLQTLVADMNAGRVEMLVILGGNPVYNAPADVKFAQALEKVPLRIHLGRYDDETGALCQWHIPESHYLETWSDVRAYDGTTTIVQPLIVPLYEATRSVHEVMAVLLGQGTVSGYDVLRSYWERRLAPQLATLRSRVGGTNAGASGTTGAAGGAAASGAAASGATRGGATAGSATTGGAGGSMAGAGAATVGAGAAGAAAANVATGGGAISTDSGVPADRLTLQTVAFDKRWQTILHNGVVPNTASPVRPLRVRAGAVAALPAAPAATTGIEVIFRPDPSLWDGRFANNGWLQELPKPLTKLTWDNAALMSPITAERLGLDNEDLVTLSYRGNTVSAPVLMMPGHPTESVTVYLGHGRTRAGKIGTGTGFNAYALRQSSTLNFGSGLDVKKAGGKYRLALTAHHHMIDLERGEKKLDSTFGRDLIRVGTFDEYQKGHLPVDAAHDKAGLPLYQDTLTTVEPRNTNSEEEEPMHPNGLPSVYPENVDPPTIYNSAENDRPPYAWGMAIDLNACIGCNACVLGCQSENNIAVVGKEQVEMSRELHWLRIDTYYKGELENPEVYFQPVTCMHCEKAPCEPVCPVAAPVHSPEGINEQVYNRCVGTKYCENNCPYKVRRFNFLQYSDQETPQIQLMANPDVTVRSRGVMEKCTYCIQRINNAKFQAKKEGRHVRDNEIVTACQQTCPTDAIVFGNINDKNSNVRRLKDSGLNYGLLTELNTTPRTTYNARIRNIDATLKNPGEVTMSGGEHTSDHDGSQIDSPDDATTGQQQKGALEGGTEHSEGGGEH